MPFQTHNPRQSDEWTVERIALLLQLAALRGIHQLTRSQMAKELTRQTGSRFSRNAVIGKLHRLGVTLERTHADRLSRLAKAKLRPPSRLLLRTNTPKPCPSPIEPSLRLTLNDLTSTTCKFITSADKQPAEYCGHPISERSYCAAHYQICYYSPRPIRPDASHRLRLMNARKYKQSLLKPSCEAA